MSEEQTNYEAMEKIELEKVTGPIPHQTTEPNVDPEEEEKMAAETVATPKGEWKFDESVAPVFDEHVRKSTPLYEIFHHQVKEFSNWYVEAGTNVYDIGTSTGQVLINLLENNYKKPVTFVGVDTSKEMIEQASQRISEAVKDVQQRLGGMVCNINLAHHDVLDDEYKLENASFMTSVLSAQFIPVRNRAKLFHKIYHGLNKGGAFVLIEKIVDQNPYINDMYVQVYHDMKLDNGFSYDHVFQKQASLRGAMRPITREENIDLLINAGFDYKNISQFFQWNNFAGFIAIKE